MKDLERALLEAAQDVLHEWDADDEAEQNDLSDEFWAAIRELRLAVAALHEAVRR